MGIVGWEICSVDRRTPAVDQRVPSFVVHRSLDNPHTLHKIDYDRLW